MKFQQSFKLTDCTNLKAGRSGLIGAFCLLGMLTGGNLTAQTSTGINAGTSGGVTACYYGLYSGQNTTAFGNSFFGGSSGRDNITGSNNSGFGVYVLRHNLGHSNTAMGAYCMEENTTGGYSVAMGRMASRLNTTGSFNVALGVYSQLRNETGSYNTAVGYLTGPAIGMTNLTNANAFGYGATNTASQQVRIGNSAVSSIGGYANWSNLSDGRFKENITEDVLGLEFINALRPVSYTVNHAKLNQFLGFDEEARQDLEADVKEVVQTGFIAQEVEQAAQKLGFDQFHGVDQPESERDHYGLRYAEFVVPLVRAVQELNTQNEQLMAELEVVQAELDALSNSEEKALGTSDALGNAFGEVTLFQNNPNPFSSETKIMMTLPESITQATLVIYDMKGQQVRSEQVNGRGQTSVSIAANELESGLYVYALMVNQQVLATKQMILTR